MKKLGLLSLLIILILTILTFLACSDDKGTNAKPDYETMKEDVEGYMTTILGSVIFGFDQFEGFNTDFIPLGGGLGKYVPYYQPADTTYYNYTAEGWHELVMELSAAIGDTTLDLKVTDSVQYKADGAIMQFPDETTDFMDFKFLLDLAADAQVTSVDLYYHVDNQYEVLPSEDVQVDGLIDFNLAADSADFHGEVNYEIQIDELVVDGDNGCPLSGTISADVEVDYDGPNASINGSWHVIITFEDSDTWTIRLEAGDNSWQDTEDFDCGDFNVNISE